MAMERALLTTLVVLVFGLHLLDCTDRFTWLKRDNYDILNAQYSSTNQGNCRSKSRDNLLMRSDAVSQIPKFNQLRSKTWYKNRTSLIHLHNMALNRAFYFSYILQKMNDSALFHIQPNWMYHYFSVAADVHANPYGINGSALYFDTNCTYPNWYQTVNFNNTLPLYAPKAWRHDDTRDQGNYLREPTLFTARLEDIGAGLGSNYTHPGFKMNPWYSKWLPDTSGGMDSLTKFTYYVGIKYSNETGKFIKDEFDSTVFFGPSSPGQQEQDERMLPVVFTEPYFDCGRSNKWVVSATSPIVDYMPRYSNWTHLRRQRFVGVVVMDIHFNRIDFNSCPTSIGNPGPSFLAGISRCKKTTHCKHTMGYGFQRGGYVCPCKKGNRYPWWEQPPYRGAEIEKATLDEYEKGFQCTPIQHRIVLPKVDNLEGVSVEGGFTELAGNVQATSGRRKRGTSRRLLSLNSTESDAIGGIGARNGHRGKSQARVASPESSADEQKRQRKKQRKARVASPELSEEEQRWQEKRRQRKRRAAEHDPVAFNRMMRIFRQKDAVTAANCGRLPPTSLKLPGDVMYGVESQFESEGRTALRLSHLLSGFMQNANPDEDFGNLRGGGRLHMEHVFGEVLANVMANHRILSSGVYFDRDMFVLGDGQPKEFFGPLAYKKTGGFFVIDSAGLPDRYTSTDWFSQAKSRWRSNLKGLKTYKMRSYVRSDPKGSSQGKFEHFPLKYKAPLYQGGTWVGPTFRCDGRVDAWVMTYVVPFFGPNVALRRKLQFKGVVTVDVPLNMLEIHQCPQPFSTANAFKNTARCPSFSTNCGRQAGFPFMRGSYTCKCRLGFEYPHGDGKEWIEGSLLEIEYEKKVRGLFSRYDLLRCRVAGASMTSFDLHLLVTAVLTTLLWWSRE